LPHTWPRYPPANVGLCVIRSKPIDLSIENRINTNELDNRDKAGRVHSNDCRHVANRRDDENRPDGNACVRAGTDPARSCWLLVGERGLAPRPRAEPRIGDGWHIANAAWAHHQRGIELVGDVRQRAGSGSAHGQALHFPLMRNPVRTTWIGGGDVRGVRAPLTGAITLVQWAACSPSRAKGS
jgi:hypothetical protein